MMTGTEQRLAVHAAYLKARRTSVPLAGRCEARTTEPLALGADRERVLRQDCTAEHDVPLEYGLLGPKPGSRGRRC